MTELRRYTSIPALIDIINTQSLTLLSPDKWTDQNDVYSMNQYKTHSPKKIKALFAICFTEAEETFHHWNVFAGNSNGVCIVFHKDVLIACIKGKKDYRYGSVTYLKSTDPQVENFSIEELPFIKRNGYNDEREYRIIYETSDDLNYDASIPIDISCINKIVFPTQTPDALRLSFAELISKIDYIRNSDITIERSDLTDDFLWKCMVDCISQPGLPLPQRITGRCG